MPRDSVLVRTTPVTNPAPLGALLNSSLTVPFLVRLPSERARGPKEGCPTDVPEMVLLPPDSGAPIARVGLSRGAGVRGLYGL